MNPGETDSVNTVKTWYMYSFFSNSVCISFFVFLFCFFVFIYLFIHFL